VQAICSRAQEPLQAASAQDPCCAELAHRGSPQKASLHWAWLEAPVHQEMGQLLHSSE
jgi:hypothetical protein